VNEDQLTALDRATVEFLVRKRLVYPEAARFGTMVAIQGGMKVVSICGWVRAKRNQRGVYTDEIPFYVSLVPRTDIFSLVKMGNHIPKQNALSFVFAVPKEGLQVFRGRKA
jgi:hypothetical protein